MVRASLGLAHMELTLIFVLEIAGLFLGVALARPLFGVSPGAGVERVAAAVGRATRAFSWSALPRAAGLVALAALSVCAAGAAAGHADAGLGTALGMLLGAALGAACTLLAHAAGNRAGAALVALSHHRFDLALTAGLRTAGAVGVTSQALAVLGALVVYGLGQWFHPAGASVAEQARRALLGLPGYALGAALVAFMLVRTSGMYAAAARASERRAGLADAATLRHESKNPALVSALVGDRLEHGAAAARLFAVSAAAATAAILLAAEAAPDAATASRKAAFPLLLWAFGLIASGAGLFAARALEAQGAGPALARGQASLTAVWVFGLVGAGYWLFPDAWPPLAAAGALGLVGGALGPGALLRAAQRQVGPLREALDGLRTGVASPIATALGLGLAHAAFGVACVSVAALLAERLGLATGLPGGERSALLLAVFGATVWSPYAFAVEAFATTAETARRMAALGGADAEAQHRIQRLVDSGAVPRTIARSHAAFAAGVSALAAALVITPGSGGTVEAGAGVGSGWITLLGAAWVLAAVGGTARRAARGAREACLEVDRLLSSGPADEPAEDRGPSYRGCEEAAGRAGVGGAFRGALRVLAGPVLLGIAWKVVYRESGPRLAAEALATFVAGAAVTALGVALTVDGACAVLAGARRANRPEGDPATYAASVTGDALAELLSSAAAPAACTLALIAAALALFAKITLP